MIDRPREINNRPPGPEEPYELVPDSGDPHPSKYWKATSQLPSRQTHIVQAACRCKTRPDLNLSISTRCATLRRLRRQGEFSAAKRLHLAT
jgi:hypothetical protein